MIIIFPNDQALLQAYAPNLHAGNLVLALVQNESGDLATESLESTTIALPIAESGHVAVGVEAQGLDTSICFWGTLRVLQFFLLRPPEQWPTSEEQLTVQVSKRDCTLGDSIPVDAPTRAQAYELPSAGQGLSSLLSARDFNLDEARDMLELRASWYKDPASAPPLLTEADVKEDRLSYTLAVCAVARNTWADKLEQAHTDRVAVRWLRCEMLLAIHRLRLDHIPSILAPLGWTTDPVSGLHGLPTLDALDMLPMCDPVSTDPSVCRIQSGRIVTRDLFWWARSALRRIESNHKANLSARPTQGHLSRALADDMQSFAAVLRNWATPPQSWDATQKKTRVGRMSLQDGTSIIPIKSLDEFKKLMPGCMRELSDRALLPHVQPHLKFNERQILYEYYLANGVDLVSFTDAVVAKFEGRTDYNTRELVQAVRSTDAYVQSSKFGLGRGCSRMQDEGYCPFYYPGAARAGDSEKRLARGNCHTNLLTLAGLREDPDGPGKRSNFPLLFTQKVARLRAAAAAPAPVGAQ